MAATYNHKLQASDFHQIDNLHWWVESESTTAWTYDLTLEEHGWSCTCRSYAINHTCKHSEFLYRHLNGRPIVLAARLAVKRAQAQGISLVSLMDYTAPPAVTNRKRVQALPSSCDPSRDRGSSEPVLVCVNCGCSNSPDAQTCRVCRHSPREAFLVHSA